MRRALLFILIFGTLGFSSGKPVIALIEVHSLNMSPEERRIARQAAQFELEKTELFRVLTQEEMTERFQLKGEEYSSSCLTKYCYQSNANLLSADALISLQIIDTEGRIQCSISLRDGKSGEEIETVYQSFPSAYHQDIAKLVRVGIAKMFGTTTRIDEERFQIRQETTRSSKQYTPWLSGSLLLLTGFAVAGYFVADQYLQNDGNSQKGGFFYADTTIPLSGIPGFFATPPANARYRAMSGAGAALNAEDGKGMINPAGLCGISQQDITFSTAKLPAQSGSQFQASWSSPFRPGIWWSHEASMAGDELANEMTFKSSIAWDFSMLSAWMTGIQGGISLKGLLVQVGQEGQGKGRSTGQGLGGGFDLGFQWQIWDGPRLGLVILDPFTKVRYSNTLTNRRYNETLPTRLILGTAWETPWHTLLAADLNKSSMVDQYDHLRFGIEQRVFEFLSLRAGLHQVLGTPIRTWSLGGGVQAEAQEMHFQIHYAYESGSQPYDLLAGEQIFTLSLEF